MEVLLGFEYVQDSIYVHSNNMYYICRIRRDSGSSKYFLDFNFNNDILFIRTGINKESLFKETFNRPLFLNGDWPWCNSEEEVITLLKALIKKSKTNSYYEEI